MPDICKTNPDTLTDFHIFLIVTGDKTLDGPVSILHRKERLHQLILRASLGFTVLPLCLLHMNMRTVTKHDAAQIAGGLCGVNPAPEPPGIQKRQKPGMVYVRMCQKHIVDQSCFHRQFTVLKHLDSLLHAIIHQNVSVSHTQIMTTACNLVIGPNKH